MERPGLGLKTHAVHAALTACTCGFWLPVWFLHWWLGSRPRVWS